MDSRYLPTPEQIKGMDTTDIRQHFLLDNLFTPGQIQLVYSHVDRMIIGGIMPGATPLRLEAGAELAASYFAERREVGIFALNGAGQVRVDGADYPLSSYEMLYIGRGSRLIEFTGEPGTRFLLMSLPAHTTCPTTLIRQSDANRIELGSVEKGNQRTIYQYIHTEGAQSCQLVMGFTELKSGSVWNTMPPHTHERRSEVYVYFDLNEDEVVFHLMGHPQETRHLVMRNGDAVISPSWSIHAGVGTSNYAFVWAMGGENQAFNDMDAVALADLR